MAKHSNKKEAPDQQEESAPRLPLRKKLLFSVIVALFFFGALEMLLLIFGVKPLRYEDDPHVGFASSIPLYVKQGKQMVTAPNKIKWFNEQTFPRKKPAGKQRVFCMGGSTTYGRPFRDTTSFCGWLREYLPAVDPDQEWELINAGGISYASYRIAALMEELVEYEPDLFIIYSGHNEFLERRTYGDIIEMPSAIRGLQGKLSTSRTYSLLSRMVKGDRKSNAVDGGGQLSAEVNTILDNSVGPESYSRDDEWKQQVLAHYRFNLARMVDIARAGGAEVVFVTPGSNLRNCTPFKSQHRAGLSADDLASWDELFTRAKEAFASGDFKAALEAADAAIAIDAEYSHLHYLRAQILDALGDTASAKHAYELALLEDVCPLRFLAEMGPIMKEVAADRDVGVVDFQQMSHEIARDNIPGEDLFLDHAHPTIEAHRLLSLALIDELEARGLLKKDAAWGDEVIGRIRDKVMASVSDYERGIALRNLANLLQWTGKHEDAYGVAVKSLELAPEDAYGNFVVGQLAEKLGKKDEAMKQYKFLTGFNLNTKDAPYFVEAHYKYAGLLAGKGESAECVRLLERTLKLKPDHAGAAEALPLELQSWGTKLLQSGKGSQAVEPLEKLHQLKSGDPNVLNLLGIALIQAGRPGESIPHLLKVIQASPGNASARNNLASAYAQTGEKQKAAEHFKETVKLAPGHLGANANLGELHLELGELDVAEAYFRKVLELQPGNPTASAKLALIRERKTAAPDSN